LKYTPLTPELYNYMQTISCQESKSLQLIREANSLHPQLRMQISADQSQFLQFLIRAISATNILEIGTFLGYSAAAMAEALPDNGRLITCDIDVHSSKKAEINWQQSGFANKITLKLGPALNTMHQLVAENYQFDLIFIDADKANYLHYYQLAKKLVSKQGVIAIDNIFYHGEVCQPEKSKNAANIDNFNRTLKEDHEVFITTIPIADGLTLVKKIA